MTSNPFEGCNVGLDSPGVDHSVVTPDDDNDLPSVARFLRCQEVGTVAIVTAAGNASSFTFYNQGEYFFGGVKRVKATGTTATVEAFF